MDLGSLFGKKEKIAPDEEQEELVIDWEDMSGQTLLDEYPIREPHAYVRCTTDEETNKKVYHVGEPELTEEDREIIDQLIDGMGKTLDVKVDDLETDPEEHLRKAMDELLRGLRIDLGPVRKEKIFYYVRRDFLGYGRIDVLMNDPNIEDISCDGADVPVFIYHRHHESMETTIQYPSEEVLESFVIRLAQRAGKHISVADPLIDATLPDGSRAIISLGKEVTTKGSTYTIRKFREEPFTPVNLVEFETFSAQQMAYMWMAVEHGMSALVVGGTASGKTTTLNASCLFIPPQMKIVSIEDTREINLPNPNWVPGATRSGFGGEEVGGKQVGEVNMFDLLKAALRQRPEYILVGEIRGEEAYAMFQAMSTGHTAYSTVHADSIQGLVHRLEEKPIEIPRVMLPSLDLVTIQIQTRIGGERVRRCKEIVEIIGLDPNSKELLTNRAYRWDVATDSMEYGGKSYILERIAAQANMSQKEVWKELEQRARILQWMADRGINSYEEVSDVIAKYYMKPSRIVDLVERDVRPEKAQEVLSEIEVPAEEEAEEGEVSAPKEPAAVAATVDAGADYPEFKDAGQTVDVEPTHSEPAPAEAATDGQPAEPAAETSEPVAPEDEADDGSDVAIEEIPEEEPVEADLPTPGDAGIREIDEEDFEKEIDRLLAEADEEDEDAAVGVEEIDPGDEEPAPAEGEDFDAPDGMERIPMDEPESSKARREMEDVGPPTPESVFREKQGLDAPDVEELMEEDGEDDEEDASDEEGDD